MRVPNTESASQRDGGSFRDPSGYVFRRGRRIYRAIDESCFQILRQLGEKGVLQRLTSEKLSVGTRFVDDAEETEALSAEHPSYGHFLEHDLISPITYPYEWSFSMLADAALHTLKLQETLVQSGYSLKDATAYNIQFVGGRPVFIDLSSIEQPARLDVWFALGQFAQMFTFPLLLAYYHGWDFRSYFLGNINGRDIEQVARSFGRFEQWLPRSLFDVALPLIFHRKAEGKSTDGRAALQKPNKNPQAQLLNLHRLGGKIRKLANAYKPAGVWAEYTRTCSYDDQAEDAKKALVRQFLEIAKPKKVLDIGCNTGVYSYIAAELGSSVVAADGDHDAVEILHRRIGRQPANITPMVIDLSNPSPAIGYRNQERASFLDRLEVDCVLALALIHHLHVSGNLPIPAIRDLFYDMTGDYLVLEYVPRNDVMFQKLLKFRVDLYGTLTLESCRAVFAEKFTIVKEELIPNSPRTLILMQKRR